MSPRLGLEPFPRQVALVFPSADGGSDRCALLMYMVRVRVRVRIRVGMCPPHVYASFLMNV